ncbi:hypothetical protein HAX54_009460, partial [Datura stramonium]|nr:hypothetical protein [Datura stramonium]
PVLYPKKEEREHNRAEQEKGVTEIPTTVKRDIQREDNVRGNAKREEEFQKPKVRQKYGNGKGRKQGNLAREEEQV